MSVPAGFMQGLLQGYQFADNTALRRRQEQRQAKLDEEARRQREFTNQATTQQLGFQQDRLNILKGQASRQDQTFQQQQEDRARQEELRQINAALAKAQAGRPDTLSDDELALINKTFPGGVHRWDASAVSDINTISKVAKGELPMNDPGAIEAFNRIYADRIKSNVGTPGKYGDPIADVRVTGVTPLPGGKLGFRLEVIDAKGRRWTPPMTESRSVDPNDPVRQVDVSLLMKDLAGRASMAKAAMSKEISLIKAEIARRGGTTAQQKPTILPKGAVAIGQGGDVIASNPSLDIAPQTMEQIKTLRARETELRRNLGNVFDSEQRAKIENELANVVSEIDRLVGLGGDSGTQGSILNEAMRAPDGNMYVFKNGKYYMVDPSSVPGGQQQDAMDTPPPATFQEGLGLIDRQRSAEQDAKRAAALEEKANNVVRNIKARIAQRGALGQITPQEAQALLENLNAVYPMVKESYKKETVQIGDVLRRFARGEIQ